MNIMNYRAAILLLPSIVGISGAARAEAGVASAVTLSTPTIIVTASGTETDRDDSGQAVSVIGRDTLENSQVQSISDILRTVPGISVARSGGVGSQTSVFIRGGESSQTLVLIDGVRINDPSSPNAAFDFGALLTGNIDNVEILRGSNSIIWGSQAIGGVINIRNAPPQAGLSVRASGEYGAHDSVQARGNIAGGNERISASLGASYYRTDGISALSAGTERDGYENLSLNGRVKVAVTDTLDIDLRGYYNDGRVEFDDPFALGPDSFPETDNEQFAGYAGVNHVALNGRLKSRIGYSRTDLHRRGSEDGVPFSFNVNDLKGVIDRFEYIGSFDVAGPLTLIFGAEHERSSARIFFPAGGGAGPDRAVSRVTSVFGQAIVRPVAGLSITTGVRHDDYNAYGGETSFGANFSYTPNGGKTRFRGSYGEGFRAPTLTEALLPFGNPALKPETAKSHDLGIEQNLLDGRLSVAATYFRRTSDDTIIFSFTSFQSENIARTRAEGVEVSLNLRPDDRLTLSAQYSLVDATSRSPDASFGNRLARRPKDSASFSADWTSPWGPTLGTVITITGDSFDDLANNDRIDGFVLASVHGTVPVTKGVELFGRIDNLFDEKYETVRGFGTLGRNAFIGVRVRY